MAGRKPTENDVGEATHQKLSRGPADMPDRGGPKPNSQITSTRVALSRDPHPVANIENKAKMGTTQVESTRCQLSRSENYPYGPISGTQPGMKAPIRGSGGKAKGAGKANKY